MDHVELRMVWCRKVFQIFHEQFHLTLRKKTWFNVPVLKLLQVKPWGLWCSRQRDRSQLIPTVPKLINKVWFIVYVSWRVLLGLVAVPRNFTQYAISVTFPGIFFHSISGEMFRGYKTTKEQTLMNILHNVGIGSLDSLQYGFPLYL